jgi:hypothetical protein
MRKSFLLFVVAMVAAMSVWSQVPQTLTYQAVVRDAEGRLICNSNVGVRISILQGSENGTAVYSDHQAVATNTNGLFTILVGREENSLGGIEWSAGPYFLKSEIDPTGGNDYTLETVQQLFSVPYALHSHTADSVAGGVTYTETDPVFAEWDKDYNLLRNKPRLADSVSLIVNEYHLGDTIINYIIQNGYRDSNYVINYNTQQGYVDTAYVVDYITQNGYMDSNYVINYNRRQGYVDTAYVVDYITQNGYMDSNDVNDYNRRQGYVDTAYVVDYVTQKGYMDSNDVNEYNRRQGYVDTAYVVNNRPTLAAVAAMGDSIGSQIKHLSDPTDEMDAVNLRTMNAVAHRLDSVTSSYESIIRRLDSISHRYDSIMHRLDSITGLLGATTGDTVVVVCDSFAWYGTVYTSTGNYQHRLTNAAGFDSILTLHLTINHGTHNSETKTAIGRYTWHGSTYTVTGTYYYSYSNSNGCSSVDTLHLTIKDAFDTNCASNLVFTVSSNKKVRFSKGNLRYQASTGIWRFADHQYDYVGDSNSNISLADSNSHWIDLFGWGTSGDSIGFDPWLASTNYSEYYVGGSSTNDLTGSYSQADWGVHNRIENGGNNADMWRTLTKGEWDTILNYRAASTINGTDSARFAKARVNSVAGLMLFPDSISIPDGITVINVNNTDAAYSGNIYNAEQWGLLESAGVVFLPAAGYRSGASVDLVGTEGYYWSSTHFSDSNAYCLLFLDGNVGMYNRYSRCNGRSVRLVMDYSASGQ